MLLVVAGFLLHASLCAQITGRVTNAANGRPLAEVTVTLLPGNLVAETGRDGRYAFQVADTGKYQLRLSSGTGRFEDISWVLDYKGERLETNFEVENVGAVLETQRITDASQGAAYLRSIDGMAIYAAKKTELIHPDSLLANAGANNARRLFVRVPGLNIWESDAGGLQLGIGGRGLSPNRSSNFNVRQNGYDIAGDALGYPESYYTPPAEAVERIEVVRGAASLQYGTQFGGMVNFLMKNGIEDKPVAVRTRQTIGSYGFFNSFNSIGGTVSQERLNYYSFFQYRRGEGWRPNSAFEQYTVHLGSSLALTPRMRLGVEYTRMQYLARQPGGLTDGLFQAGSQASLRDRNWFRVQWNLAALTLDADLGPQTRLNVRNFGLLAYRHALGFLGPITRPDDLQERDLLKASFENLGNETRLLHRYAIGGKPAALLAGIRLYRGNTAMAQGFGSSASDADFDYLDPSMPGISEFRFPSLNLAFFAEHWFNVGNRWSITPGLRLESIRTASEGYFMERAFDFAGNLLFEQRIEDARDLQRAFFLGGLGVARKSRKGTELYGNFSQNYRAITFTDLRVANPNFQVDENLQDERGYNADLGWRGSPLEWLSVDFSGFLLRYKDRIGNVLRVDSTDFNYYRFRTNIADATNVGLEAFLEADVAKWWFGARRSSVSLFANFSFIRAKYTDADEPAFDGKDVELVPPFGLKTGFNFRRQQWRVNLQYSYTAGHFSDATNAVSAPSSVEGLIPDYSVLDAAVAWEKNWKWGGMKVEAGGQNLLNNYYFTRRAIGYPGPGIIPSDIRNYYLSLSLTI